MKKKLVVLMVVMLVLLVGLRIYRGKLVRNILQDRQEITADYVFDDNKTIHAVFYSGNNPRAEIVLSDGRKLTLRQVLSADGARYANADESVVFWIKGETAFLEEGRHVTYANGNVRSHNKE
jgi:membrane-bound inhibitor of C-type lysozyme